MTTARVTWLRLTLLGILSGVLGGGVVLAFHAGIELGQTLLLPSGQSGDYEGLAPWARLLLPVAGGLLLGIIFDLLPAERRQVGVVHVLRRLHTPGGERLPAANLFTQFAGALVAIVSGHSVDKEGPSVHIGAAGANLVGQGMRISAEEDYTLAACGAAAAIAAAFNTPLAAIVFVVEVLRVRYEVTRFLPVIVASVVGAVMGRLLFHAEPAFTGPALQLNSSWELPNLIVLGLVIGAVAVVFIGLCETVAVRARALSNKLTFTLAGLVTGMLALWTPQIMGTSQDTLAVLLAGEVDLALVVALVFTKLVATGTAIGLRVPGGLIGPTLFIGGAAGSAVGQLLAAWGPVEAASPAFYATVGMVAMMGATLRAPLAALTALLELTANPNIILPGMLAVASAELTNRLALGKDSVFETLMKIQDASGDGK
ncbi:MAG: chloride channel protein [Pseudomonadota bacterium]|nr:chloride channel protein [Pseudomonadota bacterium]